MQVAFAKTYFEALTKLTPNEQSLVNKALLKFQADPNLPGLNYEKLGACRDDKMRSLRVNQDVRIILASASKQQIYLVLHVDHHNDAYAWAQNRKVEINPNTGSLQVFDVQESIEAVAATQPSADVLLPLASHKDKHLLQLGVPAEQLQLVKSFKDEQDLEQAVANGVLPEDVYDPLLLLVLGDDIESAIEEALDKALDVVEPQVDTEDFLTALQRAETLQSFTVAENESELKDILDKPLVHWRVFLHPAQRKLVQGKKNGPVRVLGGAGTGKTVVAMHRAKYLAKCVALDSQKILFTTFTKNLAEDIRRNLLTICTPEEMAKIEVVNLDAWVQRLLDKQGYDYQLLYDFNTEKELWQLAVNEKPADIDLNLQFFKEEWSHVIQPQSVFSLDDYKKAKRVGRGTRLNRMQRVAIWPVFERYRELLSKRKLKESDDAYRDAASFLRNADHTMLPYCSVIVDEAQDMGTQAFQLIRQIVPEQANDIFIVGDGHQRIYGKNKVVLSQCGINVRGRSKRLKVNYRTTDETRRFAVGVLEGVTVDDLDGDNDSTEGYRSLMHGPAPIIEVLKDANEQAKFIAAQLQALKEKFGQQFKLNECCVIARTGGELRSIASSLAEIGIETKQLDQHTSQAPDGFLNLATMHRVKGLEFDTVFLASAKSGLIPNSYVLSQTNDNISRRQAENEERALVYVSLTRAKKRAFVTAYGELSPFFEG